MSQFDPIALECLAAVIEEGGFEKAAARLNVTQSAVSQRLRSLEAQAGSVLVVRSRPLRATAAGIAARYFLRQVLARGAKACGFAARLAETALTGMCLGLSRILCQSVMHWSPVSLVVLHKWRW